ncbi:MAG: UDP-N-acetylmuramoyl-L-alanyl-D-glutamate--2,6-diaminopimelate ligase [Erysipelotrichaceae bacterium]|nr:UDP-N-acetylmuramoyl-L-alanyl-D-glutamate--2,6-diaminopimelate ligase [Erysipelotrichaceae bacterium]
MRLMELLKDVDYKLIQGNLDLEIKDIAYDSRKISDKMAFVALKGFRVDGHDYIEQAILNGCKCIIVEDVVEVSSDITVIQLEDTRTDLSKISRTLFGYPDKEMTTIAITGTKGKTTTSSMIQKILNDHGRDCGLIGTMGVFYKDYFYHTMNTSPEAYDVFKYMREMIKHGVTYLVMEVSSQSLKLKRWSNVIFDYAIFTNLSLDHVGEDEHESFSDYKYCKGLLFKQCKTGIFNLDSEYCQDMLEGVNCNIYTFGYQSKEADYRFIECHNVMENGFVGIEMGVAGKLSGKLKVSIPGFFTAFNALAAISVCDLLGISFEDMARSLLDVKVKGRMESVKVSNQFSLLIDYAYQGVAMENVLATIRESHPKRIVSVFGCGGNRSRQRRFDCGEVSGKYADLSILTADNPSYEDNNEIIEDILVGMNKTEGKYIVIPDRKEAIRYSIEHAKEGDVILILGKGHEDYQEIKGVRYPFDERVIIQEILEEMDDQDKQRLGIIL